MQGAISAQTQQFECKHMKFVVNIILSYQGNLHLIDR